MDMYVDSIIIVNDDLFVIYLALCINLLKIN